ncbi:MAG TPA: hypothetical protein VFG25_00285, partial [Nitrosopumilaceae archaeon]|nr:hypothetical protein [Nitrosopumilaceae archaeon]
MNKGIWAGLVAIAFVAGSITTGTMAYAASNAQGQPFQQLEQKITQLQDQIGEFVVDSFFDVMYEITVPSCPDGERPTLNEDNDDYTCVPRASNDSFFDITVDTKQQLETEIVALGLHSSDPDAHHVPDNLGNHMAEQNLDMKGFDIENANAILANDLLHSGNNIVAVGSITSGDSVTAANSVLTPGFVRGEQICIGDDCKSSWPASDNLGNHMAEQNLNMKRFDIENAENIRADNLLHSGNNIVAVGSITAGNEITAANSVFSPGFVKGGQLCIGDDCRSSWPAGSGPITGSDIVDGRITSVDIAANTITASDLAASSVGTSE